VLAAAVAALSIWKWTALVQAAQASLAALDAVTSAGHAALGGTAMGTALTLAAAAVTGTFAAFGALGESVARAWGSAGSVPQVALLLGALPVLWWASVELMRWAEGLKTPRSDPTLH